jgi:hypothetical protein
VRADFSARHVASGLRAYQRLSVLGCPCRIDFSRAEATLISSSGNATFINFFRYAVIGSPLQFVSGLNHDTILARKDTKPLKGNRFFATKNHKSRKKDHSDSVYLPPLARKCAESAPAGNKRFELESQVNLPFPKPKCAEVRRICDEL